MSSSVKIQNDAVDGMRNIVKVQQDGGTNACGANDSLTPQEDMLKKAAHWKCTITSLTFAQKMDAQDQLRHFRNQFHYPKSRDLPGG